jgi:hypothetical protein
MAEYIEREAAKKAFCDYCDWAEAGSEYCRSCSDPIGRIPAADVVPVKHGRWVTKKDACGTDYTICSACETEIQWRDRRGVMLKVDMQNAPFCPNCGAKMDKDGDGE